MASVRKRSPLRDTPLPVAGQSIEKRLYDVLLDDVMPWSLAAGTTIVAALFEWYRHAVGLPPSPWLFTAVAVAVTGYATYKIVGARRKTNALRQGRDGERIVAEMLQQLVATGWRVFHDVPGNGFNIDHVAIGPAGVFAIETKSLSKPVQGHPQIVVDESGITIGGRATGWRALNQSERQAKWLAQLLEQSTGRQYAAQPVLMFPGWFIDDSRPKKRPWIFGYKEMPRWVARENRALTDEQISMAAYHLDRHCRGAQHAAATVGSA